MLPQLRDPGDELQNIDQVMQRSGAAGAGVAARRHEAAGHRGLTPTTSTPHLATLGPSQLRYSHL